MFVARVQGQRRRWPALEQVGNFGLRWMELPYSCQDGCTAITNRHGVNVPTASNGSDRYYPSRVAFLRDVCTMKTMALRRVADVSRAYHLSNEDGCSNPTGRAKYRHWIWSWSWSWRSLTQTVGVVVGVGVGVGDSGGGVVVVVAAVAVVST